MGLEGVSFPQLITRAEKGEAAIYQLAFCPGRKGLLN